MRTEFLRCLAKRRSNFHFLQLRLHRMSAGEATTTPEERAEAAKMREEGTKIREDSAGDVTDAAAFFETFPAAEISEDAKQKYVLIEAQGRLFVRGEKDATYHMNAAEPCVTIFQSKGIPFQVLGGGRILHDSSAKKIEIYGFSYGFPWKDHPRHEDSKEVLAKVYPDYKITTSNEGY